MNKADLVKLGIEEDLAQQIIVLHGKDIEALKEKASTAQVTVEDLQGRLNEANTAIEGFKKLDVDGIKAAAEEWKVKAEQAQTDAEAKIKAMRFDHALEQALGKAGAKNAVAVRALLKMEGLEVSEDGTITGLQEQIEQLQTDSDYLFDTEEPEPRIVMGSAHKSPIGDTVVEAARKAAGLE